MLLRYCYDQQNNKIDHIYFLKHGENKFIFFINNLKIKFLVDICPKRKTPSVLYTGRLFFKIVNR